MGCLSFLGYSVICVVFTFTVEIVCWICCSVSFGRFFVVASYFSYVLPAFHILEISTDFCPTGSPIHFFREAYLRESSSWVGLCLTLFLTSRHTFQLHKLSAIRWIFPAILITFLFQSCLFYLDLLVLNFIPSTCQYRSTLLEHGFLYKIL